MASCFGTAKMIQSRRPKHAELVKVAPEELSGQCWVQAIYHKICPPCELDERRSAGMNVELRDIRKEINRLKRGRAWVARGKF